MRAAASCLSKVKIDGHETCSNKSNENESNLGKALYLYNQAAVAAFGK